MARSPPPGGSHAIIAVACLPVGYLRWQRVSRETLDSVGLLEIPENSADVDLFLGEGSWVGKSIGPKALAILLASLRADASIPLVGVSTAVENVPPAVPLRRQAFRLLGNTRLLGSERAACSSPRWAESHSRKRRQDEGGA